MGQNIRVSRNIEFLGEAANQANIKGNFSTEKAYSVDNFDQKALDTTNDYTVTVGGTNDAIELTLGGRQGVKFTTGSGDNEISFLGTELVFDISQNPVIESKIEITDVSGTVVFFGFSDANTETTPDATIDAADGTIAAAATDAAGFFIDADKDSSAIYYASKKTGGSVTGTKTPITWTDGQAKVLRVALDSAGNARFYVDGVQVGYTASAVTDVPLCAIWNAGTRANDGSNTVYARYLRRWQDV